MPNDETVNVRYMVDDVDDAIAFYTKLLGFEVLTNAAPAFADVKRGNLRLLLAGPDQLRGTADARRRHARTRRLEPHPLHRRRHRRRGRPAPRRRRARSATTSSTDPAASRSCSRTRPATSSSSSSPPVAETPGRAQVVGDAGRLLPGRGTVWRDLRHVLHVDDVELRTGRSAQSSRQPRNCRRFVSSIDGREHRAESLVRLRARSSPTRSELDLEAAREQLRLDHLVERLVRFSALGMRRRRRARSRESRAHRLRASTAWPRAARAPRPHRSTNPTSREDERDVRSS